MERIGDLHMILDGNNFNGNSKLFTFMFGFLAFYTFYWLNMSQNQNNLQVEQLHFLIKRIVA